MALNRITTDSIADNTVIAQDIVDGTVTLAKLASGILPPAIANSAAAYANAAFATANTGSASGSYANSAFASANLISGIDATQNTNITNAGTYANAAFATANTGSASGSYANSAFSTANTASTNATNAGGYANSAFAKANTAGTGTVTSVATGNGLSGGTITSTGTLVVACPTHNTVGSYVFGGIASSQALTFGSNYAAGTGSSQVQAFYIENNGAFNAVNSLSGTWKWMTATTQGNPSSGILCRVS